LVFYSILSSIMVLHNLYVRFPIIIQRLSSSPSVGSSFQGSLGALSFEGPGYLSTSPIVLDKTVTLDASFRY
jgi:hypothetical protein